MAAKKKSKAKKGKAVKKGAKKVAAKGTGQRGRKAVLTGCTPEQGKRLRRAFRAKGFMLSSLKDGETVSVKEKGGRLLAKCGKIEIDIPVEAKAGKE